MNVLPTVNEDIRLSLDHEMADPNWTEDSVRRLEKDNPVLAKVLGRFLQEVPSPARSYVLVGTMTMYRLLESQAECNKMAEEINLG